MSKIQAKAVYIDGTIGISKPLDQAITDGDVAGGGASPLLSFMGVSNPKYRKEFVTATWKAICYDTVLKRFAAVGDSGSADRFMVSENQGATWLTYGNSFTQAWTGIAYGASTYVVVASGGHYGYSTNGSTFTTGTLLGGGNWLSVAYGNGVFVAVAGTDGNTSQRIATSSDGITWTRRSHTSNTNWINVEFVNGIFIAGGDTGIATSSDGITWTYRYSGVGSYSGFAYGKGVYVATGNTSTIKYSSDAITWTDVTGISTFRDSRNYSRCAFGNGMFYAISSTGNGFNAIASKDGITWRQIHTLPGTWNDVIYGPDIKSFVCVGSTNTNDRIMMTMPL